MASFNKPKNTKAPLARTRLVHWLAVFCLLSFGGCGESGSETFVLGSISVDGEPIDNGLISFFPTSRRARNYETKIDKGQYRSPILPGEYRVEIRCPIVVDTIPLYDVENSPVRETTRESLPERYNQNSELSVIIETGKNEHNFELVAK